MTFWVLCKISWVFQISFKLLPLKFTTKSKNLNSNRRKVSKKWFQQSRVSTIYSVILVVSTFKLLLKYYYIIRVWNFKKFRIEISFIFIDYMLLFEIPRFWKFLSYYWTSPSLWICVVGYKSLLTIVQNFFEIALILTWLNHFWLLTRWFWYFFKTRKFYKISEESLSPAVREPMLT